MGKNKLLKRLKKEYVIPSDNTRVVILYPIENVRLTPEQIENIRNNELLNRAYVYDSDKANYYKNLLDFYNNNFFGYGIVGNQTKYDYTTPEGQVAIQSNFDYAKGNAYDFLHNVANVGLVYGADRFITKFIDGIFQMPSKTGYIGTLELYSKNPIGGGAEAIVVENTPTTVGKMTSIPVEEMTARNLIPNTMPSEYIGYVKYDGTKLPTYILRKLKILTELNFPKYVSKLDKTMEKSGFRRVNDPNVQYRAYTNGQVVVDDVSPGNVGLDWLGRPKIVDFNLLTVPEWIEQGFTIKKNGGKLFSMKNKLIPKNKNGKPINLNTLLSRYPEVSLNKEPWADEYFRNNPNVAGMAIGGGLNGIQGKRRVIVNPYNELMKNPTLREGLLINERLRHYMDETNFILPYITSEQINKYKGTSYENDTINIGRTEVARYLVNDKSNSLTDEQIKYIKSYFNK